ncbi:conserved hypothetical protein [Leishmania mexicana MHOM/GT/2001/U1103]|uniref:BD-FAE-like domain-containing protein n=1 Tax=Leishmania mexicana (strain MHOM/GT/2001/U1103) TaxID=929439 RepID=E9AQ35_LEIMU|nr:conserved hypothetical protein [Leishmania mexicana MHOM/GT/2001/U1103]CBZ25053.1 conserved hypothetical protein [Leishmania mexicana MHOM/GT/2001/U1103]
MLPYAIRQIVWMLTSALQLIYALSTGVVWVMQMLRFFVYGACVGVCFISHWWWYLTSPNIIRRVSYRSSEKTKWRNILRVLEAEGVDLREALRKDSIAQATQSSQQIQRPSSPAAAARRRRRLATAPAAGQQNGASRDCSDSLPHTVDGEVDDRSLSQLHNPSPFSTLRCWEASGSGYGQRTSLGISSEPLGRDSDSYDEVSFVSSSSQHRRRPTPSRSTLIRPCHGGTEASTSGPPGATALERLMGAVTCNLNPADGSAMRSLPLRQRQDVHSSPSVTATAGAKAHGSSSSSGGTETQPRKPRRNAAVDEAAVLRAAPADSTEEQMSGCRLRGSPQRMQGYEGRPVYYKTLPKVNPSSDPMLRDVLAAFQEAEASDVTVGPSQPGHQSGPHPRRQPAGAAARRLRRRSGAPPPQCRGKAAREPLVQPQRKPHALTFSKENLFAELDEEDEEDRMNLHNRATVDIVLPAPLDAIMKTLEYTQQSHRLRRKRFPIVIDVSGVVWIIGSHLWSTMIARVLAQRGYVVFCPDYRNFPQTTMEGMTLDISDAIAWVLNNAERYNGDLNNVTLIGQSAGAHLTMMSLLSQAQLSAYRHNAEKGIHEGVPPPSDVAYNVPRYNPRESIHRYVGLSGMYNIEGLVDHFQAAGLTTPVLYQIAGGRDQLARYSIHAYFDDRRGGDTGEVLPDNIFDFFPQRMFFVHGDADKSAPVTESASLVGMMRAAQERYTLRRSACNEEARRHAQRSRRLLPGALAAAAGEVKSSSTATAVGGFPSTLTGLPSRRAVVADFDAAGSAEAATTTEQAFGAAVGLADNQEIVFVHSDDLADTGAAPYAAQQQQQYSYGAGVSRVSILSLATISPIIPPSREDRPQPPVELGFLVIPGGRHSDAFVDECIAAGRSCCVDFLCDYESTIDFQGSASEPGSHGPNVEGASGSSLGDSVWTSSLSAGDRVAHLWAHAPEMNVMPDAVLPLAVPYEDRSLPLRLCTVICPF